MAVRAAGRPRGDVPAELVAPLEAVRDELAELAEALERTRRRRALLVEQALEAGAGVRALARVLDVSASSFGRYSRT